MKDTEIVIMHADTFNKRLAIQTLQQVIFFKHSFGVLRANIKKCKRLKDLAASLRDIYCSDLTGSVVYILK